MESKLVIYNTLTRQKERFEPLHAPNVGMYVCGPTVYGDPHLGHARPAITFDLVFRYLKHLGYKERYVRNITDVGHLEHDADEGEDKIAKKARLEQLEPMEVVQYYTNRYHNAMTALNVLPPSVEPHATGHIAEQQQLVQEILNNGFAYESNGSIYFDIEAYNKKYHYGILSGRTLENIKDESRELAGVGEKHNQADFALWKKAQPEHIMKWHTTFYIPEGRYESGKKKFRQITKYGFPGWHCECTAMGRKYLGETFDIHCWMHNNMLTINGQKMGKSYNNFITLEQFFTGNHPLLEKAYSAMTIRFFVLSAHYRGTVDFSNEALQAAEKGLEKLMNAISDLERIQPSDKCDAETERIVKGLRQKCYDAMNDDFATPQVISHLFEACTVVNKLVDHKATICADCLKELSETMRLFAFDILGLREEKGNSNAEREAAFGKVVDMVLDLRAKAKADKDWATSDKIRDELAAAGFEVKDTKDGVTWRLNK